MERMNPKKLNVADIRNMIRLEENEIKGPTYPRLIKIKLGQILITRFILITRPIIDITS